MVPPYNALLAYRAVQRINERGIPGDIVELGVWKGGVSCFMAMAMAASGRTTRRLWLFDTYAGMPEPTADDDRRSRKYWTLITNGTATRVPGGVRDRKWAYAPLDEVQHTMARTGYPPERISFVKGKVEDTLPLSAPESIALLRLDTDWFTSTKAELDILWPRLSPGGWLYVDDYASFRGARKAVDGWLQSKRWTAHARQANAYMEARGNPKEGAAHDQIGSFHVWKAQPFEHARPFDLSRWPTRMVPTSVA